MKILCVTFLLAVAAIVARAEEQIPSFINLCSRDDPQLNQCVTNLIMDLKEKLKNGLPEFHGASMDPLLLEDLDVIDEETFNLAARGITIVGLGDFQISDMNVNLQEGVNFHVILPKLNIVSDYELTGAMMLMPITGKGRFTGDFTDIDVEVSMTIHAEKTLVLDSLKLKAKFGGGKIDVQDQNEAVSTAINAAANTNLAENLAEFFTMIEGAVSEKIVAIAREPMKVFTFDQLFPPARRQHGKWNANNMGRN